MFGKKITEWDMMSGPYFFCLCGLILFVYLFICLSLFYFSFTVCSVCLCLVIVIVACFALLSGYVIYIEKLIKY